MIGLLTKTKIIDNSGGIEGKCIQILKPKNTKSGRRRYLGKTGDLILVTLTKVLAGSKLKKGNLYKAIIVRTKKEKNSNNNLLYKLNNIKTDKNVWYQNINKKIENSNKYLINIQLQDQFLKTSRKEPEKITNKFNDNSIVLVKLGKKNSEEYTPIGTRIKGPICRTLKNKKNYSKIISLTTPLL